MHNDGGVVWLMRLGWWVEWNNQMDEPSILLEICASKELPGRYAMSMCRSKEYCKVSCMACLSDMTAWRVVGSDVTCKMDKKRQWGLCCGGGS
eukprot:1028508-Amphidinium_carterae.1